MLDPLANISRTNETHILWPLMQGLPNREDGRGFRTTVFERAKD
jgi:hypothetical protein